MSPGRWQSRLLGHAQFLAEHALSPKLYDGLAERLSEDYPVTFAILTYDRRLRLLPETGIRHMEDSDVQRYFEHFAPLNPFTRVMKEKALLDATVVLSDHLPTQALKKTEYYNEFLRPRGEAYALSMSLRSSRFGRASLTFYRGDRNGGDFSAEDSRRLEQLRPFMRNALLLRTLVRERGEAGGGLEGVRDPVVRWTPTGKVEPVNDAGEVLLCQRCRAEIPRPDPPSFAATGRVYPDPERRGVLVTVPGEDAETPMDRLRRRFGLTKTEAAVAQGLRDGLSYKEIAAEFGVTTETVHTHVKSIHRKADVSTTGQFIARCLTGR